MYMKGKWKKLYVSASHNELSGLQGGTTDEYYHFTLDQHTGLLRSVSFLTDKRLRILEFGSKTTVVVKGNNYIPMLIGTTWFFVDSDTTVSTASDLDTGSIGNGKDYYVYACNNSGSLEFKISLNSTYPSGFTADNSRKIGGFHTLCADVGTISGHSLSGYSANDILPQSVWDLKHRPVSEPAGMVWSDEAQIWVDIYLASGTGSSTASTYGGTISDTRNWMDFVDDFGAVKKQLLDDAKFQLIAAGSNEETNIASSADSVTTGGHSDTAGRRMISDIGCEDCCGVIWQWLTDQSYRIDGLAHSHTENQEASYTQNATTASGDPTPSWGWYNLPGSKGSLNLQGPYGDIKLLAGAYWGSGTYSGSQARHMNYSRWYAYSFIGGRGWSPEL